MFKFNFNNEEEKFCRPDISKWGDERNDQWYRSKKVEISHDIVDTVKRIPIDHVINLDYNCGIIFSCLSAKEVMNKLKINLGNEKLVDLLEADKVHSDLIPGKYEGGLKTWECTRDLAVYFMKHEVKDMKNKLENKHVLDLGCGSGILGIMCLLLGASVTFQDYNQEVLEEMTVANIFLNCNESVRKKLDLYSGDWSSFLDLMLQRKGTDCKSQTYNYILTSETIYNPKNYKKIIAIIKKLLRPDGLAFIAAKTHYFGVGGNLNEFEALLQQEGLKTNMCWTVDEGVSRGILEVKLSNV